MDEEAIALLVQLVVMCVFGGICAAIAGSRGRSAVGWFFVGMFTGCIGIILVLVLPDQKEAEAREKRIRLENRRLREQLDKERQVADQRHQHVERRLGVHDEALGVDTSRPPQLPGGTAPAQLTETGTGQWFYARDNERQGPVSAETIRHLLQARAIQRDTLVWSQGMQDWSELRHVDEFREDVA
ncbi:MAG: DUF4339 domain-containing protein [Planctomycetes bacterium]|nr:DUF4339 domain-containing protein [Planctomycetota bacterium]